LSTAASVRRWASDSSAPRAILLIRLAVGLVFLSEGIQKFLFPEALGAGRFTRIGLPAPEVLAPFVGAVEIVCGVLVVLGLATRMAALPLVIDMVVAIATTKVPMLVEQGFWTMAHESRTDFAMILGAACLVWIGAGPLSVDGWLARGRKA
jgi:uncharacterized membrane protein YphA (DoxX/SURF4 family)